MSNEGGCRCGNVRIAVTGKPLQKSLCHCNDCRKISSSAYSTNIALREADLNVVSGAPKPHHMTSENGKELTDYFCSDCGSTLFRMGESWPGFRVLKVGVMDDPSWMNEIKPGVEYFVSKRVEWVAPIEGAKQLNTMT